MDFGRIFLILFLARQNYGGHKIIQTIKVTPTPAPKNYFQFKMFSS